MDDLGFTCQFCGETQEWDSREAADAAALWHLFDEHPVRWLAIAGQALEADHVYVIPADAILTVHDGRIELKRRTSSPERPLPAVSSTPGTPARAAHTRSQTILTMWASSIKCSMT